MENTGEWETQQQMPMIIVKRFIRRSLKKSCISPNILLINFKKGKRIKKESYNLKGGARHEKRKRAPIW